MLIHENKKSAGFALIFVILVIFSLGLVASAVFSASAVAEQRISRDFIQSQAAYYSAESAAEDSIYRIIKGKNYQATNSLDVGSSTALISISDVGSQKIIHLTGEQNNRFRSQELLLDVNRNDVSFYYGVQVGEGGLIMNNNSQVLGSIYSNGSIQGSNGATVTGDVFVAGVMPILGEQSLLSDSDFIFGQSGNQIDAAQSFIPSSTDKLSKISLYLKKFGSPGDKTVRILTDNGNKPSKTLVSAGAYGTLSASQISQAAYGWIDVSLNTPPTLQAGVKYWIVVDTSASSGNYFFWGRDSGDSYASGTGKYSPDWNASSPTWYSASGDLAFKTWMGGVANSLSDLIVGGTARAHLIDGCSITGDAYYQEIQSSSVAGTSYPGADDSAMEDMPISDANIQDWEAAAEAGGVIESYTLTNFATGSLGPKKINGNLNISNGAVLTITGTIYVTGNINISNNAIIQLSPSYGELSGTVITDGLITVSNNCLFQTSIQGSYLLFLSTKTGDAANIANNATTVIFYASAGNINISNNANLKEVTAYRITLANNSTVTYESGLASAKFSSGSGASWQIDSWKEVP